MPVLCGLYTFSHYKTSFLKEKTRGHEKNNKKKKGAQTRRATGQLEPIEADEQLLHCCSCVALLSLPPNGWELVVTHREVWSGEL